MSHEELHERRDGEPRRRKMMPEMARRASARQRDDIAEAQGEYEEERRVRRERRRLAYSIESLNIADGSYPTLALYDFMLANPKVIKMLQRSLLH